MQERWHTASVLDGMRVESNVRLWSANRLPYLVNRSMERRCCHSCCWLMSPLLPLVVIIFILFDCCINNLLISLLLFFILSSSCFCSCQFVPVVADDIALASEGFFLLLIPSSFCVLYWGRLVESVIWSLTCPTLLAPFSHSVVSFCFYGGGGDRSLNVVVRWPPYLETQSYADAPVEQEMHREGKRKKNKEERKWLKQKQGEEDWQDKTEKLIAMRAVRTFSGLCICASFSQQRTGVDLRAISNILRYCCWRNELASRSAWLKKNIYAGEIRRPAWHEEGSLWPELSKQWRLASHNAAGECTIRCSSDVGPKRSQRVVRCIVSSLRSRGLLASLAGGSRDSASRKGQKYCNRGWRVENVQRRLISVGLQVSFKRLGPKVACGLVLCEVASHMTFLKTLSVKPEVIELSWPCKGAVSALCWSCCSLPTARGRDSAGGPQSREASLQIGLVTECLMGPLLAAQEQQCISLCCQTGGRASSLHAVHGLAHVIFCCTLIPSPTCFFACSLHGCKESFNT